MINKAELIREALASTDWDRDKIASVIGCRVEYVRVVEQRLLAGGETPSNRKWRANNPERMRAHWREQQRRRRARQLAEAA